MFRIRFSTLHAPMQICIIQFTAGHERMLCILIASCIRKRGLAGREEAERSLHSQRREITCLG